MLAKKLSENVNKREFTIVWDELTGKQPRN